MNTYTLQEALEYFCTVVVEYRSSELHIQKIQPYSIQVQVNGSRPVRYNNFQDFSKNYNIEQFEFVRTE